MSPRFVTAAVAGILVAVASTGAARATTEPTTEPAPAPVGSESASAYPVVVEHSYGSTTIDARPERIVSIDPQWTDVLTALDAPLVGALADPYIEGGVYPWQVLPTETELIPANAESIPFEAIAALDPDLIVVTWAVTDQATFDRLTGIAPTIPLVSVGEQVDPWQRIATVAGDVLGEPEAAVDLIASVDEYVADLAAELPGLEGKTYALANYVPGDAMYVVADPDDGAATVFAQLGMSIDPELVAAAEEAGQAGRVSLSLEQIGMLDADALFILTNGADTSEIPGFDALPAVQSGAFAVMSLEDVVGLNTPTPLSVPYALEVVRPALEAAAAG